MVNVYLDNMVIARVNYNNKLDRWINGNWQSGGVGRHKGITKLRNGQFVIIYGTQWQGERDYAEVVSDGEALQEILVNDSVDLLEQKKFKKLKDLYEEKMIQEEC